MCMKKHAAKHCYSVINVNFHLYKYISAVKRLTDFIYRWGVGVLNAPAKAEGHWPCIRYPLAPDQETRCDYFAHKINGQPHKPFWMHCVCYCATLWKPNISSEAWGNLWQALQSHLQLVSLITMQRTSSIDTNAHLHLLFRNKLWMFFIEC